MTIVSKIEEMFTNPEKASLENVNAFVREAMQFVNELKGRLSSSEESIREQAKKEALRMQAELKEQMKRTQSILGKNQIEDDLASAKSAVKAESNGSKSNAFDRAFKDLQNRLIGKPKQKKKPKRVKEWLAS